MMRVDACSIKPEKEVNQDPDCSYFIWRYDSCKSFADHICFATKKLKLDGISQVPHHIRYI